MKAYQQSVKVLLSTVVSTEACRYQAYLTLNFIIFKLKLSDKLSLISYQTQYACIPISKDTVKKQ